MNKAELEELRGVLDDTRSYLLHSESTGYIGSRLHHRLKESVNTQIHKIDKLEWEKVNV